MLPIDPYKRIIICGATGSGKSTLAQAIAKEQGIPYIEMDALFWGPGWVKRSTYEVELDKLTSQSAWVFDGNYSKMRHLTWERAELLIWLDYSFFRLLCQLTKRTLKHIRTGQPLCNGNYESVRLQFFSKKSIYLWLFRSYFRKRKEIAEALHNPRYRHLKVIRLRRPPK